MKRGLALAAFLALGALAPALARAQGTNVDTVSTARAEFERGVVALEELRFADALAALQASDRLRPLPVVAYNLGLAYRGLGRNLEAIAAFERYLREPGPSASTATLASVREQLGVLRRSLVVLSVVRDPPEAALWVDGRPRDAAERETTLDPGAHVIEVRAEGYRDHRQEVTLPPSAQLTLSVRLESLEGTARVIVEPSAPEGVVSIDGHRAGTGRVERPLAAGDHRIDIVAEGYLPFHRTVHVGQLGVVRVDANMVQRGVPGWVLPATIAGGALVIAGGIVAAVFLVQHAQPGETGNWLNVTEGR